MALELKGLKAKMLKVQKRIENIGTLADGFDTQGAVLEKSLQDITAQLAAHEDDLTFAANVLGNGSGEPLATATVPPPETPPTNPEPPLAQQTPTISITVGSGGSGAGSLHTFRSEAEQQIAAGHAL